MYSIQVYVPHSHLDAVKTAMFKAGAGRIGDYDSCAWQTEGKGQFKPLQGSNPYLGKQGEVETVREWKVEMVCEEEILEQVIEALKASHPYETPAYLVFKTLS